MKNKIRIWVLIILAFILPTIGFAETIGVFYDPNIGQIKFAAEDVKKELEANGYVVEMKLLSTLNIAYANKKVVIALANNSAVTAVLTSEGGAIPTGLGVQAYGLRTVSNTQKSYWVLGGDNNGAMYGGLQMAENIKFEKLNGTYNVVVSPSILNRGIKLNLPWDKNSGTYGKNNKGTYDGTSSQLAIKDVWDMTFWTTWFDHMARNRYNNVSLWSCNPFSSLVVVPGYEDCSIQDVTYFDGTVKKMTIAQKIVFWKDVMAYAHARGFEFYFFNWNVFTYGATGKHGIEDGLKGEASNATRDYMYKAMLELLKTYPDFDGFGLSIGENQGTEDFVWNTYGKAMFDYAKVNTQRKLKFIHRLHWGDFAGMMTLFKPLIGLSNVSFDTSIKHSQAHMYSTPVPDWWSDELVDIKANNLKTWLTVRNDDFYYLTWGDPSFARDYIAGMNSLGPVFKGFYMGCDGYNPTRTFFMKNSGMNGQLEVERQQYMMMIWGRLTYDLNTSDTVFKNYLANKYPTTNSTDLFDAWRKSSSGVQRANEVIQSALNKDYQWWPEGCQRVLNGPGNYTEAFVTAADFADSKPAPGSLIGSIANTASNKLYGKKSSLVLANEIEADALAALSIVNAISAPSNTELSVAVDNSKAMSYLSLYYANKIRGATYIKVGTSKKAETIAALGSAYCWWKKYTNLMDAVFKVMDLERSTNISNWHMHDAKVLKEYNDNGGVGTPSCDVTCTVTAITNGCTGSTVDITGSNNCGGSVTLTAKPAANCNFVNFTDGTSTWTTNPLTVNVTADKQYTAKFSGALQAPVADFTSNTTSVLVGGTVNFTDSSANTPTSWSWSFPGGTPATSTAQKPSVKYDTVGEYDVTLTTTNAFGSNLKTKAKYVVVSKPATNVTSLTGWVAGTDNPKVPGSNRLLVVMVMGESTGDFAATSVTYGGQTMTKQTDRSYYVASSRSYASIFTLNEAGLNLATNGTIVVNWNVIPTSGNSIYSTILSNVDQATPVSAVSNNALTGTTVTIPSGLATASGDMVVMCGATEKNNVQAFDNGFTKEFESDTAWGDGVGGYKIGNGQIETPSFTQSLSGRMVICAFVAKKLAAPLAIDDFGNASKNGIKIYPNPTSGILNINFPNSDMSREIQIINTLGQKVHSVKTHNDHITIDVKSLNLKGFIVVKVIAEDGVSNHKVLVK